MHSAKTMQKLSKYDDSETIILTLRGPKWMMPNPIGHVRARKNQTWLECLKNVPNLRITSGQAKNVMINRLYQPGKPSYAAKLNSKIGKFTDSFTYKKHNFTVRISAKAPKPRKRSCQAPASNSGQQAIVSSSNRSENNRVDQVFRNNIPFNLPWFRPRTARNLERAGLLTLVYEENKQEPVEDFKGYVEERFRSISNEDILRVRNEYRDLNATGQLERAFEGFPLGKQFFRILYDE